MYFLDPKCIYVSFILPIFSRLITNARKNIKIYYGQVEGANITQLHKKTEVKILKTDVPM